MSKWITKMKGDLRRAIMRDHELVPTDRLIGVFISDHINDQDGHGLKGSAWKSQKHMAEELGISLRTMQYAVESLKGRYFEVRKLRRRKYDSPVIYTPLPKKDWPKTQPVAPSDPQSVAYGDPQPVALVTRNQLRTKPKRNPNIKPKGKSDMNTTGAADALASPLDSGSRSGGSDQDRQQPEMLLPIDGGMKTESSRPEADQVVFPAPRSTDSFEEDGFRDSPPCPQSNQAEPKAPVVRQRCRGGFREANAEKANRRLQEAQHRWVKDLMDLDAGGEIFDAMDEEIQRCATDAEIRKHHGGQAVIEDWWQDLVAWRDQADREAAA